MTTTSLYVSSTGASARLSELEVIANNLANANTTGFRSDQATFETALEASLVGTRGPGGKMHSFVQTSGASTRHVAGAVTRTGGELDAAIDGPGFFQVETPAGVRYTRSGAFHVDPAGNLVTSSGHPVNGAGGPIQLGSRSGRIQADGNLIDAEGNSIGRLAIHIFDDPNVLHKEGANLFQAPEAVTPNNAADMRLMPGLLEGSNVQPAAELARLVALQRAYDATMQVLEADDTASNRLIQEVSR